MKRHGQRWPARVTPTFQSRLPKALESERQRRIHEVDVVVGIGSSAGFFDEIAGEEMAVADVAGPVAVELHAEQRVKFGADVVGAASAAADEGGALGVVEGIVAAFPPEEILLEQAGDV